MPFVTITNKTDSVFVAPRAAIPGGFALGAGETGTTNIPDFLMAQARRTLGQLADAGGISWTEGTAAPPVAAVAPAPMVAAPVAPVAPTPSPAEAVTATEPAVSAVSEPAQPEADVAKSFESGKKKKKWD